MKEGIIVFAGFILLVLICLFSIAPIGTALGKWNTYWNPEPELSSIDYTPSLSWEQGNDARKDCGERAESFFQVTEAQITSHASSTSAEYKTYDCYAVKWLKIPPTKE